MMFASLLLFVLDWHTHGISDGFNTDLYLVTAVVLLFVTGLIVNFMSGPDSS